MSHVKQKDKNNRSKQEEDTANADPIFAGL